MAGSRNESQPWRARKGRAVPRGLVLAALLSAATAACEEDWTYRVQPGDSLWTITHQHLTGLHWVRALQQRNNVVDPYALPPGRELRLPLAWTRRTPAQLELAAVVGEVNVVAAGSQAPLAAADGLRVASGDRVLTGADGHALLRYPDGSMTQVFPNSSIQVETVEMLGAAALLRARLIQAQGRSEHRVQPQATVPLRDIEVIAPAATTSVRGTHFRVASQLDPGTSLVGVLEGQVLARPAAGGHGIALPSGQGLVARTGDGTFRAAKLLAAPDLGGIAPVLERRPFLLRLPPVPGAVALLGDLSLDPEHRTVVASVAGDGPVLALPDLPDGRYWLRVRAVDADGLEGLNSGTELRVNARPEPPFLSVPVPGGVVATGRTAQFSWSRQPDASGYDLEVARVDPAGAAPASVLPPVLTSDNRHALSWQPSLVAGDYVWRVRSRSALDAPGPFSDWQPFRAVPPGPGIEPPVLARRTLTLAWPSGGDPSRFRFQMALNADFERLLVDEVVDQAQYSMRRPKRGTYHVRVARVADNGDAEPWSSPQQVDVPRSVPVWLAGPAGLLLLFAL